MLNILFKRICQSINRIYKFYSRAIYYRFLFKYNFLKYSLFIPAKFFLYLLYGSVNGHIRLKKLNLLESDIIYENNKIFKAINVTYFFEQFVDQIYEKIPEFKIQKGMMIIDCGAACGEYTLNALKKGAKLVAIEPDRKSFLYLQKNLAGFQNAKLYNYALSNVSKGNYRTLDFLLKNIHKINILKIDVEGYELKVLQGAKNTLKKTSRIVMEVHSEKLFTECENFLKGYKIIRKNYDNDQNSLPLIYAFKTG